MLRLHCDFIEHFVIFMTDYPNSDEDDFSNGDEGEFDWDSDLQEDLEENGMSFLEHLEDFRWTVGRSILAFFLGVVIVGCLMRKVDYLQADGCLFGFYSDCIVGGLGSIDAFCAVFYGLLHRSRVDGSRAQSRASCLFCSICFIPFRGSSRILCDSAAYAGFLG